MACGRHQAKSVISHEHDDEYDDSNDYSDDGEHACVHGCFLSR